MCTSNILDMICVFNITLRRRTREWKKRRKCQEKYRGIAWSLMIEDFTQNCEKKITYFLYMGYIDTISA